MRGGALPAALLCCSLGLALACAPRRAWAPSLFALALTACVSAAAPLPKAWADLMFSGCWLSVITCTCAVYRQRGIGFGAAVALSANVGIWCGGVITVAGSPSNLLEALPCVSAVMIAAPARHRMPIAVQVLSSWLIAIALLAATLQVIPVTPGYVPDHIE